MVANSAGKLIMALHTWMKMMRGWLLFRGASVGSMLIEGQRYLR